MLSVFSELIPKESFIRKYLLHEMGSVYVHPLRMIKNAAHNKLLFNKYRAKLF